jgi:ElaB/YqjD/DUF883 family membrane-anchored ribosome-binding protein
MSGDSQSPWHLVPIVPGAAHVPEHDDAADPGRARDPIGRAPVPVHPVAATSHLPNGRTRAARARNADDIRSHAMNDHSTQLQLGRQKIADDLRVLVADSEELLRLTASASGEQIDVLRARMRARLDDAKLALADASVVARGKYKVAADNADQYVHDNPWQAVGMGVGLGILLGVLAAR